MGGAGAKSSIRSRRSEAQCQTPGRERSALIKTSCNSQVSATESQKGKADEPRPTETRRSPPHQGFTHTAPRRAAARPSRVGTAAGPTRHRRSLRSRGRRCPGAGWRQGGWELRPRPERSAVQLQGQRRRLLASGRLSQVAAFGGRGVLRPRSGLLLPPPKLPRPPRAPCGFAPSTRLVGPRRWRPRGVWLHGAPSGGGALALGGGGSYGHVRRGGAELVGPGHRPYARCQYTNQSAAAILRPEGIRPPKFEENISEQATSVSWPLIQPSGPPR